MKSSLAVFALITIASGPAWAQAPLKKPRKTAPKSAQTDTLKDPIDTTQTVSSAGEEAKGATSWPDKAPSWMLALGLTSTPGIPYEKSRSELSLSMGELKGKDSSSSDGTSTKMTAKVQQGELSAKHGIFIFNRKIHTSVAVDVTRTRTNAEMTDGSGTSAIKMTSQTDSPSALYTIGFQARRGLWVGTGTRWTKEFRKAEIEVTTAGASGSKKANTNRLEHVESYLGLEYMNFPGHAGLEYSIKTESKEVSTAILAPMRIALSETIFLNLGLENSRHEDVEDGSQDFKTTYMFGFGQQFPKSAYLLQLEFSSGKSWETGEYSTTKGTQYNLVGMFGEPKGLRTGVAVAYLSQSTSSSTGSKTKLNGPYLGLKLELVE